MKKLLYISFIISLLFVSCSTEGGFDGNALDPDPDVLSDISNISVEPRIGGALIRWELPADSSFTYVEVRYDRNGKEIVKKVSRYTDSLLITGLINKEPTAFEIQTVNDPVSSEKTHGNLQKIDPVTPIKREPEITYFTDDLVQLDVTADMLDTFTQETSEGPKENLVDGDPSSYWHSAWSGNTAPLPHWIQINFDEPTELGAFKYYFRNPSSEGGRPNQWGLEISDDGESWTRVWESKPGLSVSEIEKEREIDFGENFEAQFFRIMILATEGDTTFAHLGEISFYTMRSDIIDKEKEAEEEYYNF